MLETANNQDLAGQLLANPFISETQKNLGPMGTFLHKRFVKNNGNAKLT